MRFGDQQLPVAAVAPNEDITGWDQVGMLPCRTATASWGGAKGGTSVPAEEAELWHWNGLGGLQIGKKEGTRVLYSF